MRRSIRRLKVPRPGTILGVVAVVLALAGTAIAASTLKLGQFDQSSRDRLAGTGVIQYASQTHTVAVGAALQTFTVNCELSKKASAGGYKVTPAAPGGWFLQDAYPTGGGYTVRGYNTMGVTYPLTVYANCVKSRKQTGTPPS